MAKRNERRTIDGFLVEHFQIIGTDSWHFSVWEREERTYRDRGFFYDHQTITHFDGVLYGDVRTLTIPAELDALPRGDERIEKVTSWYADLVKKATAIAEAAFPEYAGEISF